MWNLLEVEVFESEVCLHDASGLHSGTQYILFCGDVPCLWNAIQGIQVAVMENVFIYYLCMSHKFRKGWRYYLILLIFYFKIF